MTKLPAVVRALFGAAALLTVAVVAAVVAFRDPHGDSLGALGSSEPAPAVPSGPVLVRESPLPSPSPSPAPSPQLDACTPGELRVKVVPDKIAYTVGDPVFVTATVTALQPCRTNGPATGYVQVAGSTTAVFTAVCGIDADCSEALASEHAWGVGETQQLTFSWPSTAGKLQAAVTVTGGRGVSRFDVLAPTTP